MTFGKECTSFKQISKDSEDSGPDIIVEEELNVSDSDSNLESNCGQRHKPNDGDKIQSHVPEPSLQTQPSPFTKNKLPLGRGRGLARLPDSAGEGLRNVPVANVVPIGYQSSENRKCRSTGSADYRKNENIDGCEARGGNNNNNLRSHGVRQDYDMSAYNYQRQNNNNNNSNDNYIYNHQNSRRGGGRGGGNYGGCRNNNNNNNNNTNNGKKNYRNNSNNSNNYNKQKKMRYQPTYHQRTNNTNNTNTNNNGNGTYDRRNVNQPKEEKEKVYHPDGRLEYKIKTPDFAGGFGSVMPTTCLRCHSHDHLAMDCPDVNMFF